MNLIRILYLLLLTSVLFGQNENDRSFYYDFGEHLFAESYFFPTQDPDSQLVVTIFRFSNSIIPFTKADRKELNVDNKTYKDDSNFVSNPVIFIEYKDSQGIIRKRDTWEKQIFSSNYENTRDKSYYNFGLITSKLSFDDYSIDIELSNKERSKPRKVKIPLLKKININKTPGIGEPIFAYRFNNQEDEDLQPYILNKNIGFGSEDCHILLLVSYYSEFEKYNFSIEHKDIRDNKNSWDGSLKFTGIATPKNDEYIEFNTNNNDLIILSKTLVPNNIILKEKLKIGLLEVILGADKLVPGKYDLKVWSGSSKDTSKIEFSIEWENMPLSLKNPEYAAEMMYFILTDDEYKEIKSGSSSKIFKKILDYWKKRDPTPNTLYNEAMAEYFRRVDYAFFNYQSTGEKDGAKTDRGKIYILYGNPDSSERSLDVNNQTVEVWKYNKLKKEFVFQSNRSGKLELIKIIN